MNELKKIAYNCRKATLLIEKKQLARLTIRERLELKIHLAGCSICQLFQQQSILINQQIRKLLHSPSQDTHLLDDEYKQALQDKIDEKLKRS